MKINGKEYGFYYSVGAVCDFNDWVVKNPERSYSSAVMQKAVVMSKAYCKVHGGTPLTLKELVDLPAYVLTDLDNALAEQEKKDSERTVEVAEDKSGNAESAAQ
jgi:hypothetical protein